MKVDEELLRAALPIAIAVLGGLLLILLLRRLLFGGPRGNNVLLTGLSASGKTAIWSKLSWNGTPDTVTSQKENVSNYVTTRQKRLQVVDVPGFDKVRYRVLDRFSSSVAAIVFVVDSATIQKDIRDAAEYLYNLLADAEIQKSRPRALVFCNKQDLDSAKSARAIQTLLEKEMTILRETRASRLSGTASDPKNKDSSSAGNNNSYLGIIGKDFEFSDLGKGKKVEFVEGSCRDEGGLEPVVKFLSAV